MTARRLFTNQNAIGPNNDLTTTDSRSQQKPQSDLPANSPTTRLDSSKPNGAHLRNTQLCSLLVSSLGVDCSVADCQPSVFTASHRCRMIISEDRIEPMNAFLMMDDQTIKPNMSYVSLINVSNPVDQEPNVSRRDSYSQSTSHLLMNKPSLFFANIFSEYFVDPVLSHFMFNAHSDRILERMTHEQRVKSISQLTQLHEDLSKSTSKA